MVTICKTASNRVRAKICNAAVMVTCAGDERSDCGVSRKARRARMLSDEASRRCFRCEAWTLFQPEHPNIDVVNQSVSERVADFLTGRHLVGERMVDKVLEGPLGEKYVNASGKRFTDVLVGAPEHNVVHRDLKPRNTMMAPSFSAKVMDFGLPGP